MQPDIGQNNLQAHNVRRGILLVLVSAAAFGALPIFAKLAYREGVNLKTLLAMRFVIAALIMWLLWATQHRKYQNIDTVGTKAQILPLIAMGAFGYVGQSFSYFTAVGIISATATSLLLYTYPTIVTLLAWLLYREYLSGQKILALGVTALGTAMVLGVFSSVFGGTGLGNLPATGIAWGLAAAVIYSCYVIAGARYSVNVPPIFSSAIIISSAAIVYVLGGALSGELSVSISLLGLVWTAGLALVSTVIAITTFFGGIATTGPSRASIISTVEPAVTVALASLVLSEAITLEQLGGAILILTAVILYSYRKKETINIG